MSKRDEKKELILEAGLQVMKQQGYNGTGIKDIVKAAGVPKGSFYTYFDSKEAFAVEAIDKASSAGYEHSRAMLSTRTIPPTERLTHFFASAANNACENQFKIGCFMGNMCQEMADGNEAIRLKVKQAMRLYTQLIEHVLEEAQMSGEMSADKDPKMVAEFLFNAWEGALMRVKASCCREPLDAFLTLFPTILK